MTLVFLLRFLEMNTYFAIGVRNGCNKISQRKTRDQHKGEKKHPITMSNIIAFFFLEAFASRRWNNNVLRLVSSGKDKEYTNEPGNHEQTGLVNPCPFLHFFPLSESAGSTIYKYQGLKQISFFAPPFLWKKQHQDQNKGNHRNVFIP